MSDADAGMTDRPAAELEALRPILEAFRRGTKRSKLRVLSVVCPNGHTLLEVFPTPAGPTALWRRRERFTIFGALHEGWTEVWEASPLSGSFLLPAIAACRCHDNVSVDLDWVRQQVVQGRVRRAIAPALESRHAQDPDICWE